MEINIENKRALITCSSRGIGKDIAIALAKENVSVCLISRTENELKDLCDYIKDNGGKAIYHVMDLFINDKEKLNELKNKIKNEFGSIDIIINNANIIVSPKKLSLIDENDWYKTIDINLNFFFNLFRLFIEDMKNNKWGRIIHLISLTNYMNYSNVAYSTVKGALEYLNRNIAYDYSKFGINSNIITQGILDNEKLKKHFSKENIEKFLNNIPSRRLGKVSDITDLVIFLCSEKASYINGVNIDVSGGLSIVGMHY